MNGPKLTRAALDALPPDELFLEYSASPGSDHALNSDIRQILTGRTAPNRSFLEERSITVPCSEYFVAVFKITSIQDPLPDVIRETSAAQSCDSISIVQQSLRVMLSKYSSLYGVFASCGFFSGAIAAIFSVPEISGPSKIISGIVDSTVSYVRKNLAADVVASISSGTCDALSLTSAYNEALSGLNKALLLGTTSGIVENAVGAPAGKMKTTFLYEVQILGDLLLSERYSDVSAEVHELLERHLGSPDMDYGLLQSRLDIIKGMISEAVRISPRISDRDEEALWALSVSSVDALSSYVDSLCGKMSAAMGDASSPNPFTRAVSYISENYSDYSLCIDSLCEAVGVSKSHLQRLFSAKLGTSVGSYINRLRITNSKELLLNLDRDIGEIALEVGFSSVHTYARNFQKYEGTLPSEFRKAHGA